jgi:rod shape-determining protein MreC
MINSLIQMKKYWLFVTYILIGLFLFVGSFQDRVKRAQFLGKTVFYPFTYPINEFKLFRALKEENFRLQQTIGNQILTIVNQETKLQKFENSVIEFEVSDKEANYIFADVIGFSGDFFGRTIVVSKGIKDGVKQDDPVFASHGIVGKVIIAHQNFSLVLPISHYNFKLAVYNKNTGEQGILVSDIYANVAMEYMKMGSINTVGDTIVTSNLSSIFPPNFPVGKITRLAHPSDYLSSRAIIQPFTNISNIRNVYIINRKEVEINEDNPDFELINSNI